MNGSQNTSTAEIGHGAGLEGRSWRVGAGGDGGGCGGDVGELQLCCNINMWTVNTSVNLPSLR